MKKAILTEKYGEIVYEESYWTGKRKVNVGGTEFKKINKKTFVGEIDGERIGVAISGNYISGVFIDINGEKFRVTESAKWYDYLIAFIWLIPYFVWANSPVLCAILPIVGGGLGGAVAGVFLATGLLLIKSNKNIAAKIGISFAFFAATILVNFLLAVVIIKSF
jgi:hypothetical protein